MTVKLSQLRNVRSFAKKTLGSTRVGRAMRLPGAVERRGLEDIVWMIQCLWVYNGSAVWFRYTGLCERICLISYPLIRSTVDVDYAEHTEHE